MLTPLPVGVALASEGVPSAVWLLVPIPFLILAFLLGAMTGQVKRIAAWISRKRGHQASSVPRVSSTPNAQDIFVTIAGAILAGLTATVMIVSIVEMAASDDLEAIRRGGNQQLLTATFVPLDMRLMLVAWIDPAVRPAYELLIACPVLLVSHSNGRTVVVEATPRQGSRARFADISSSAISFRELGPDKLGQACQA